MANSIAREFKVRWVVLTVFAALSLPFSPTPCAWAADTTSPSAPGRPTEGSTTDQDYDGDGSYTIYWAASSDPESGIAAYQLQEKIGAIGTWTPLSSTITSRSFYVSGRLHNTRYFYRVQAKNGAGLWGSWSSTSDGILVDKTPPGPVIVTDDGVWTSSTTTLHATWTASSDLESGILGYQYQIRQDSTSGLILVNWTGVGTATQVTRTGLTLLHGKKYFLGVRARNRAGLYSSVRYSDGIWVDKNVPGISAVNPPNGSTYMEGDAVAVSVTASDLDGNPLGYQFSIDGVVKRDWASTSTWTWPTAGFPKAHRLTTEVRDPYGRQASTTQELFGYRKPRSVP